MLSRVSTFSLYHRFQFVRRHIYSKYLPIHRPLSLSSSQFRQISRRPISGAKVFAMAGNSSSSASSDKKHTNRLASEHSPYLLQHAHNPVNWYSWGEEAFEEARRRDVPIFLSIGYSTCHWCHVMEVESFEDEEVAKLLNDWFVSIKVDREERPDVDKVYMTYVQALYGGGGWPLSVFLSPDLKPLMGGTYFPPEDKHGRPGFKTVLRKVKEAWDNKRDMLVKSGSFAIEQLSEALSTKGSLDKLPDDLPQYALSLCAEQLSKSYNPVNGGFSSAPKFPRPVEIQLMLHHSKKMEESRKSDKANEGFQMVYFTLKCMARGGIHDHIGGGFHRYSVDEYWHVPHFEKMLYDQGQLVNVYLDAFLLAKDRQYASIARDVLDYLRRDMIGPQGEIFSAEDADSAESESATRKKEGAFYVWTSKEIDDILGEHATLFKEHYYVKPSGNCDLSKMSDPHKEFNGKNVLIERNSTEALAKKNGLSVEQYLEILGMCRKKLFDVRLKRHRPHLDDKVIVSWNGLVISAFARASKILEGEPEGLKHYFPVTGCDPKEYIVAAEKAVSFIRRNLYNEETHRLQHSFRNGPSKAPGFIDDYAFLISGLLDLYECGGDTKWLEWATELQDTQGGTPRGFLLRVVKTQVLACFLSDKLGRTESDLQFSRLDPQLRAFFGRPGMGILFVYFLLSFQYPATQDLGYFDQVFMDKEGGGYFNTPGEDPSVLLRVKEDYDGAEPSGNSVAAINLVRLSSFFSDSRSGRYRENAERLLANFETRLKEIPMAVPLMCCAADMLASVPLRKQILLVGPKTSPQFDPILAAAHAAYDPNKTVIHIDASNTEEMKFWEANNEKIATMAKGSFSEDKVVALVCQNFTCKAPLSDPKSLEVLLSKRTYFN